MNIVWFYDGDVSTDFELETGDIAANAAATAIVDIPTVLWVTPAEILSGNLGFSASVPIGHLEIDATIAGFPLADEVFTVGDPSAAAFLGWHWEKFHLQTGVTGFFLLATTRRGRLPTSPRTGFPPIYMRR